MKLADLVQGAIKWALISNYVSVRLLKPHIRSMEVGRRQQAFYLLGLNSACSTSCNGKGSRRDGGRQKMHMLFTGRWGTLISQQSISRPSLCVRDGLL